MPEKISRILNDRESGSVALLNQLISALEEMLLSTDLDAEEFSKLLISIRESLNHFAAIGNFLASLINHSGQEETFPAESLEFIADYKLYWQNSVEKIAENFLKHCYPGGLTILTHSHSETIMSLLDQLHNRQFSFRVLQTLSSPGEEGKKSHERMRQLKLQSDLIDDLKIKDALGHTDLILMGCDTLLTTEFLNKTGTRAILEQARKLNKRSILVTESRKEILHPGLDRESTDLALFEWVPLDLIDRIVTER